MSPLCVLADTDASEYRQASLGHLSVLPDCLISYLVYCLDLADLLSLARTCKILRVFCYDEPVWLALCTRSEQPKLKYMANWRQTAYKTCDMKAVPSEALESASKSAPPVAGFNSMFLYKRWYRGHMTLQGFHPERCDVERISMDVLRSTFKAQFDALCRPGVFLGLTGDWQVDALQPSALLSAFGSCTFEVAKPGGGNARMDLADYFDYMARQHDEEPLYIFDSHFGAAAPAMLDLYRVPDIFDEDYFDLLGEERPAYRWLVLGPPRSGASWHIDPALTSAWNTLLAGEKRWALYPPHIVPPGLTFDFGPDGRGLHFDVLTPMQWFLEVLPMLPLHLRPLELVQKPGETVYVPGGWWHCVLNLDTSVALTQNFVSAANLDRVIAFETRGAKYYFSHPLRFYPRGVAGCGHFGDIAPRPHEVAEVEAGGGGVRPGPVCSAVVTALRPGSRPALALVPGQDPGPMCAPGTAQEAAEASQGTGAGAAGVELGSEEGSGPDSKARVLGRELPQWLSLDVIGTGNVGEDSECDSDSDSDSERGGGKNGFEGSGEGEDGVKMRGTEDKGAKVNGKAAYNNVEDDMEEDVTDAGGRRDGRWVARKDGVQLVLRRWGWHSGNGVGRWLRRLLRQRPALQPAVLAACTRWAGLADWRQVLSALCAALGLPAPSGLQLLPESGSTSVVFLTHHYAVKFVALPDDAPSLMAAQAELLGRAAARSCPSLRAAVAAVECAGVLHHLPRAHAQHREGVGNGGPVVMSGTGVNDSGTKACPGAHDVGTEVGPGAILVANGGEAKPTPAYESPNNGAVTDMRPSPQHPRPPKRQRHSDQHGSAIYACALHTRVGEAVGVAASPVTVCLPVDAASEQRVMAPGHMSMEAQGGRVLPLVVTRRSGEGESESRSVGSLWSVLDGAARARVAEAVADVAAALHSVPQGVPTGVLCVACGGPLALPGGGGGSACQGGKGCGGVNDGIGRDEGGSGGSNCMREGEGCSGNGSGSAGGQGVVGCTWLHEAAGTAFWAGGDGDVWTETRGHIPPSGPPPSPPTAAVTREGGKGAGSAHGAGADDADREVEERERQRLGMWYPFVAFLRHRRDAAEEQLEGEESMPPHLLRLVPEFLPADPAVLLGLEPEPGQMATMCGGTNADANPLGARQTLVSSPQNDVAYEVRVRAATAAASGSGVAAMYPHVMAAGTPAIDGRALQPCWVHCDLSADNVLLRLAEDPGAVNPVIGTNTSNGGGGSPVANTATATAETGVASGARSNASPSASKAEGASSSASDVYVGARDVAAALIPDGPLPCEVRDFADVGVGDPLYDMVGVLVSCLAGDLEAFAAFVRRYAASPAGARAWRRRQSAAPVHVLMCYMLMHREDVFSLLAKHHPCLRSLATLQEVQQYLFGGLPEPNGD